MQQFIVIYVKIQSASICDDFNAVFWLFFYSLLVSFSIWKKY